MHSYDEATARLAEAIFAHTRTRLSMDPPPLDMPRSPEFLARAAGQTITPAGIGGEEALRRFTDVLAPASISVDHQRYLAYIPGAPTKAATLFDLVVGTSSPEGSSWTLSSGVVYAENQALRWLADLAGLPPQAGGVFVQGGTLGNLSALVAARHGARARRGGPEPERWKIAATAEAHASIATAGNVMDVDIVDVEADAAGRLSGAALRRVLDRAGDGVFAVVASAGTTNLGIVDRLDEAADVCGERGLWLHVDGAYGGAALAAPTARAQFAGIERADSFIVDPHKWLFAPYDCCALLYREPEIARAAHTQHAGYLDPIRTGEWNPSDYAINLTRRARGMPFWFSLAMHGTDAYVAAVERTLAVARFAAEEIRERRPELELLREPDLSVVAFRRLGWSAGDYATWSARLLERDIAFVTPSLHDGEAMTRFAVVNPRTTEADIVRILDTMG